MKFDHAVLTGQDMAIVWMEEPSLEARSILRFQIDIGADAFGFAVTPDFRMIVLIDFHIDKERLPSIVPHNDRAEVWNQSDPCLHSEPLAPPPATPPPPSSSAA